MKTTLLALTLALACAGSSFAALPEAEHLKATPGPSALKIMIPKVDFREATVREALDFLGQRAKALDPNGAGINLIFKSPMEAADNPAEPIPGLAANEVTRFTLSLNNVPLGEVVKYMANLCNCTVRMDPNAVVVIAPVNGKIVPEAPRKEVPIADAVKVEVMVKPLLETKIPKVAFRDATLKECFEYLGQRAKTLLPGGQGVNLVMKVDDSKALGRVTFAANDLPLMDAYRYVAELAGLELSVEEFALVVSAPKGK